MVSTAPEEQQTARAALARLDSHFSRMASELSANLKGLEGTHSAEFSVAGVASAFTQYRLGAGGSGSEQGANSGRDEADMADEVVCCSFTHPSGVSIHIRSSSASPPDFPFSAALLDELTAASGTVLELRVDDALEHAKAEAQGEGDGSRLKMAAAGARRLIASGLCCPYLEGSGAEGRTLQLFGGDGSGKNEVKVTSSLLGSSHFSLLRERIESMMHSLPSPAHYDSLPGASRQTLPALHAVIGLLSKSLDEETLRYSLMSSVGTILGVRTGCRWWSASPGQQSMTLACSYNDDMAPGTVLDVEDDALLCQSMTAPDAFLVEEDGTGGLSRRGLMVIRVNGVPAHAVECIPDTPAAFTDEQLYALEILAANAGSRFEYFTSIRGMEDAENSIHLLSSYLSDQQPTTAAEGGADGIWDIILTTLPGIEGVAQFVRSEEGYACTTSKFRDGSTPHHEKGLKIDFPAAASVDGIHELDRETDREAWNDCIALFGDSLGNSSRCITISSGRDSFLVVFLSQGVPTSSVVGSLRPFVSAVESVHRTRLLQESEREASLAFLRLMDMLAQLKLPFRPADVANAFADMLSSVTGGDDVFVYGYDEVERAYIPISNVEPKSGRASGPLNTETVNILRPPGDGSTTFLMRIGRHGNRLWERLAGDPEMEHAVIVGTGGRKPVTLTAICFREGNAGKKFRDDVIIKVCEVLSALLEDSRSFTDLLGSSRFSSQFLRTIGQSLRSRDGRWSVEAEQIANNMCALTGGMMEDDFVFLFSTAPGNDVFSMLGKWARKQYDEERVREEVLRMAATPDDDESWTGGRKRKSIREIKGSVYPALHEAGIRSATIMIAGEDEGALRAAMLLLSRENRTPKGTEMQIISASLEAARLMLESRSKRVDIDWSMSAMRSELRIAKDLSSTFDIHTILESIVTEAGRFMGSDVCFIELLDERGACSIASMSSHSRKKLSLPGGAVPAAPLGDEHRRGLSSMVMETGSNLNISGEEACGRALAFLAPEELEAVASAVEGKAVCRILGTPISFAGKLLGILVCMKASDSAAVRKGEVSYMESVSALAATAIENSRNIEATFNALSKLKRLDTLRSNFSSIAAHELRTPLTSIRVYIELMKMGKVGQFTDQEMHNVENLLASISELTEIINNMLEFTRMEAMLLETEMVPISLQPVIEEICAQLSPAANAKSIRLGMEIEGEVTQVNANAPLIKRVVNNLIGNALKFTPEGGRIDVRLRNDREGTLIVVEDTGKGIPAEDLPFIFDRFHVVDSSILHSRTGFRLGLPISKLIVERHGGRIWADSELGKGSKFHVLLPVSHGVSTEAWLTEATNYIH